MKKILKKEGDFVLGNYLFSRLNVEAADYSDFNTKICQYFIFANALIHFTGYQNVLNSGDIESIIQKFDLDENIELEKLYSFTNYKDPCNYSGTTKGLKFIKLKVIHKLRNKWADQREN